MRAGDTCRECDGLAYDGRARAGRQRGRGCGLLDGDGQRCRGCGGVIAVSSIQYFFEALTGRLHMVRHQLRA